MKNIYLSAALILSLSAVAAAQDSSAGAKNHPEWYGYYSLANNGFGPFKPVAPRYELDTLIMEHLQPWATAKMEMTDGVADDTGAVCLPDGVFRNQPFAGRFLWLPTDDEIVMAFSEVNTIGIRRIYTGRGHPRNVPLTWNGDSVGHWEGDTLVVDTIGFNDKSWLMSSMEPHTSEAHMIERIRMVHDGDASALEIVSTVEDRHALTSAYTFSRYYRKNEGEMRENICNDNLEDWKLWRQKALQKQYDRAKQVK